MFFLYFFNHKIIPARITTKIKYKKFPYIALVYSKLVNKIYGYFKLIEENNKLILVKNNFYRRGIPVQNLKETGFRLNFGNKGYRLLNDKQSSKIEKLINEYNCQGLKYMILDFIYLPGKMIIKLYNNSLITEILEDEIDISYNELRKLSRKIYDSVSPVSFKIDTLRSAGLLLYNKLIRNSGIINALSDSSDVVVNFTDNISFLPVEFFFNGKEFFLIKHRVSRFASALERYNKFNKNILIVNGNGIGLNQQNEIRVIEREFRDFNIDIYYKEFDNIEFIKFLSKYRIIHFTGHSINNTSWKLKNTIFDISTCHEKHIKSSLIIANSCFQKKKLRDLVDNNVRIKKLLKNGLLNFISSICETTDENSVEFSRGLYPLIKKYNIGEAVRKTRVHFYDRKNPAWAGYILYGNPVNFYKTIIKDSLSIYDD